MKNHANYVQITKIIIKLKTGIFKEQEISNVEPGHACCGPTTNLIQGRLTIMLQSLVFINQFVMGNLHIREIATTLDDKASDISFKYEEQNQPTNHSYDNLIS